MRKLLVHLFELADKYLNHLPSQIFHKHLQKQFHSKNEFGFLVDNLKGQNSLFANLAFKHGTDKGGRRRTVQERAFFEWEPHNYADFYDLLFRPVRHEVRKVFECGIGSNDENIPSSMGANAMPGASLFAWADFFPNAEIWGADIDPKCLISGDRIRTVLMDQLSPNSIRDALEKTGERGGG